MLDWGESPVSILVVGDLMLDRYLFGSCERISPEAPVQVVDVHESRALLGGAGNVVRNILALGARAHLVSIIGDDAAGDESSSFCATAAPMPSASFATDGGGRRKKPGCSR